MITSYHEGGEGFTGQIEYLSLETGERRLLIEDGAWARYAPTGHLVFSRRETLLAVVRSAGDAHPAVYELPPPVHALIESLDTWVPLPAAEVPEMASIIERFVELGLLESRA